MTLDEYRKVEAVRKRLSEEVGWLAHESIIVAMTRDEARAVDAALLEILATNASLLPEAA